MERRVPLPMPASTYHSSLPPSLPSSPPYRYTSHSNPFGDSNLHQQFIWKAKEQQQQQVASKKGGGGGGGVGGGEGGGGGEGKVSEAERRLELIREIEKVRKRREDREKEQEEMERLKAEEARLREAATYDDWERKEEEFHLEQARVRSKVRTGGRKGGREGSNVNAFLPCHLSQLLGSHLVLPPSLPPSLFLDPPHRRPRKARGPLSQEHLALGRRTTHLVLPSSLPPSLPRSVSSKAAKSPWISWPRTSCSSGKAQKRTLGVKDGTYPPSPPSLPPSLPPSFLLFTLSPPSFPPSLPAVAA